ncbi:solute carrier family 22 member 7, partial [Biomphalaria glabrata]
YLHQISFTMDSQLTIDDILVDIGCGKALWILEFLITFPMAASSFSMLQMAFAGNVPNWECVSNETKNLSQSDFNVSRFKQCFLEGVPCQHYEFDNSALTVVNQWSLVCDLSWVPATVISIQMAGVLLGNMVSGHLSDQFGRKRTLYGFLVWHSLCNVVAAFSVSWQMFAVCRFFIGTGIGGILSIVFPYSMEFLPPKWRPVVAVLPIWMVGVFALTATAYLLPNWSHMHIAIGLVPLALLLGWVYLPESIRWLAVHDREREAIDIIDTLSKRNGKLPPSNARSVIENVAREKQKSAGQKHTYTYLDLFSDLYLAKLTLILCFFWFVMSLVTYGVGFAVSSFSGNLYLNYLIITLLDIPALPPTLWALNRFGRRWSVIGLFAISTVCAGGCLVAIFAAPVESRDTLIKWLTILCKVAINAVWDAVQTWQSELYPTVVRNLGYGASNTAARVGGIAAPFVINLDHLMMTFSIMTSVTFISFALCFTLPETLNRPLEDNILRPRSDTSQPVADDTVSEEHLNGNIQGHGQREQLKSSPI